MKIKRLSNRVNKYELCVSFLPLINSAMEQVGCSFCSAALVSAPNLFHNHTPRRKHFIFSMATGKYKLQIFQAANLSALFIK